MLFLPTGSTVLDKTIGGGIPAGKIINIIGDKSTGKTLIASETIAQSRKLFKDRLVWKYRDIEAGFSFDTMDMYGFEMIPEEEEDSTPNSIEEFDCDFHDAIESLHKDQILIYVLDCLDALTSDAEMERGDERRKAIKEGKKYDKGTYALEKQKFFGGFFREKKKQIKDKNAVLVVISQIRDNIGVMFGRKWTRTGGRALDFYASQILVLAEAEKYEMSGKPTGICTRVKAEKVKVGRPFQSCFVDILFNYGIDDVSTNIKYLYNFKTDSGKDKGKRQKIEWDKKEYSVSGLIDHIETHNLEEELKRRVIEKWDQEEAKVSIEAMGRKPKRDILK